MSSSSSPSADPCALDRVLERNLALPEARRLVVDEFEKRYIELALARHGGNVTRAAASSGVARRHFYTLLEKHRRLAKSEWASD